MGKTTKGATGKKNPVKKVSQKNIFKKQTKEKRETKKRIKSIGKDANLKIEKKDGRGSLELSKAGKIKSKNQRTRLTRESTRSAVANSTGSKNKAKKSAPLAENDRVEVLAKNNKSKNKKGSKGKNESAVKDKKSQGSSKHSNESQPVVSKGSQKSKNKKQKKMKLQVESKVDKLRLVANKNMQKGKEKSGKNSVDIEDINAHPQIKVKGKKLNVKKLEEMLTAKKNETVVKETPKKKKNVEPTGLRDRMMTKLRASRFRYLNETLYNNDSAESKKYFKEDPDAFLAYHEGYKQQVEQWPVNPVDIIISSIEKLPKDYIIADFGCGDAKLAASVSQKVHSFDFVAVNDKVKACDMAHTPLLTNGVNVVVFCLSLMGTNLTDYITEANRVLKKDGILKIAEVESRFDKIDDFINVLRSYGFKNTWKDLSHNLFYFMDFKKERDVVGKRSKLPQITLKPCLYKKR